jgi:hypothetical protein
MRRCARDVNEGWYWACDTCIDAGRAVAADVAAVKIGVGTPFAAYVDRPFVCEDCGAPFVFAAREQKDWFERLGFLVWVFPKQCLPCRRKRRVARRAQRELMAAVAALDPTDAEALDRIAGLYDQLGVGTKAVTMRARARNRRRGKDGER